MLPNFLANKKVVVIVCGGGEVSHFCVYHITCNHDFRWGLYNFNMLEKTEYLEQQGHKIKYDIIIAEKKSKKVKDASP